jgi:hypothetical protein
MMATPQERGFVMVRQAPGRTPAGSPDRQPKHRIADDWPVYVAVLPAILASAAIGITAAIALGTASSWNQSAAPDAADLKAASEADDYVKGLAKLGIATIPHSQPSAAVHSGARGGRLPLTQLARGCVLLG